MYINKLSYEMSNFTTIYCKYESFIYQESLFSFFIKQIQIKTKIHKQDIFYYYTKNEIHLIQTKPKHKFFIKKNSSKMLRDNYNTCKFHVNVSFKYSTYLNFQKSLTKKTNN